MVQSKQCCSGVVRTTVVHLLHTSVFAMNSRGSIVSIVSAQGCCCAGRPRTRLRSSLVASDFTLPRGRRRAASPGAGSVLARRGRRVRRRLVRSGQESFVRGQGRDQRQASDADMILNALERSISSRDHSGLSTSSEHRYSIEHSLLSRCCASRAAAHVDLRFIIFWSAQLAGSCLLSRFI